MRQYPTVTERPDGKLATTKVTNELARAVISMSPSLSSSQSPQHHRAGSMAVWLIWDKGPNGEADLTGHGYWIRLAYLSNPGDDATKQIELQEVPLRTGETATDQWIMAWNLAERPPATGGDDNTSDASKGTHLLAKGTAIGPIWAQFDDASPHTARWVFSSARQPARLLVFGNRTRGGCYKAYVWNKPAATSINFDDSGALTSAQFGIQGHEVIAINLPEIGHDTHDLTSGTPYASGIAWGMPSLLTSDSDSKPVYEILSFDELNCT